MARKSGHDREFKDQVGKSAHRRVAARDSERNVLSWLGTFGIVGWSIALPTLAGIALGIWLDRRVTTGTVSWTLTFMILGLVSGLAIAWGWVRREGRGD